MDFSILDWRWLPVALAPFAGSLMGVVIERVPAREPLSNSRSRCTNCSHVLSPADLVPLLSFLWLRGRCRYCQQKIGFFAILIECLAAVMALIAVLVSGSAGIVWCGCLLGWALLCLAWIDLRYFILPDCLTLPLVLSGLAATAWLFPALLTDHAWGALLGYASFKAIAFGYRSLRKREGLGGGDAKLIAAAGAWLGWPMLPDLVLLAALIGLAGAGITWAIGRRIDQTTRLPFGPALATATWVMWLYGFAG